MAITGGEYGKLVYAGDDFIEFNRLKEKFIVYRKLTKTLQKQAKQKGNKNAPEVEEYTNKTNTVTAMNLK